MIGIIVAMQEELDAIKEYMKNIKENKEHNANFFIGNIEDETCVIAMCGIGKVNAARSTQMLIDKYNPDFIVNIGVAGGISDKAKIGDIIIGEKLVQYDFDLTAFGRELGEISDNIPKFIYSDKGLVKKAENILNKITQIKSQIGIIATGDKFVTEKETAKKINEEFNADCVEMEGGAIAQVCKLNNTPFIAIRSISDSINDNNKIDFDKFLNTASKNAVQFLNEFILKGER